MISTIYSTYLDSSGVCTDTRNIKEGTLFIALKGESFNGNDFILASLNAGASHAIADENREEFRGNSRITIVINGLETLQELAKYHRSKFKIPVIGLTGSNGKTTSKELLNAALSQSYNAYATKGNLNNHIGVPLSLLEVNNEHEIAIIEMGANHQKEISFLCSIAAPDYGYITNIGLAHLEGFGGEEGVYIGKKELFDFLRNNDGKVFVNTDDQKVKKASEGLNYISYGQSHNALYQGEYAIENGLLNVSWWRDIDPFKRLIKTQLSGAYNFSNVMSAVALARYFGVPDQKIKVGLENYIPENNRSQIQHTSLNNTVIVDCYNANPSSMLAAIENISNESFNNPFVILGDMLELGESSIEKHKEILQILIDKKIQGYFVGNEFLKIKGTIKQGRFFEHTSDVAEYLKENKLENSSILLKGSRKMKLEQLLELL